MSTTGKLHLIERAAEQLLRTGEAPALAGPAPAADATDIDATRPPAQPPQPDLPLRQNRPPIALAVLAGAGLIDVGRTRKRVSEEFRLVQSQLLRGAFAHEGGQAGFSNLLMVTSARPKEGKTFTALNLAAGIARQGDRPVLLVDADPKQGSLTDTLGLTDNPGLLDLAAAPMEDPVMMVRATDLGMLSVLPVGQHRSDRPELFASDQMLRVLQTLGQRFPDRLIVLDVSPCLSTSDPAALAPAVGQTLFVIEAERTQREEVEASLDLIQTCPSITLLLNKVQMSTPRSFGSYSYAYSS